MYPRFIWRYIMSNKSTNSYVNLTATGLAFINRLRWVQPQNGSDYLALTLNSWHGKDGKNTTLFEAIPKGDSVYSILQDLMDQCPEVVEGYQGDNKITVTCGFTVAGLKPGSYVARDGNVVHLISCNLIRIQWIKVNGEYFYREKDQVNAENQGDNQDYEVFADEPSMPDPPRRQAQAGNNGQQPRQQNRQVQSHQGHQRQGGSYPNGQKSQARHPQRGYQRQRYSHHG